MAALCPVVVAPKLTLAAVEQSAEPHAHKQTRHERRQHCSDRRAGSCHSRCRWCGATRSVRFGGAAECHRHCHDGGTGGGAQQRHGTTAQRNCTHWRCRWYCCSCSWPSTAVSASVRQRRAATAAHYTAHLVFAHQCVSTVDQLEERYEGTYRPCTRRKKRARGALRL
jgi:hypothetical protein